MRVIYPHAKALLMQAQLDLVNDDIRVTLLDAALYSYSAAHTDLAQVSQAAQIASTVLSGKLVNGADWEADPAAFLPFIGPSIEAILIWANKPTTKPLIYFADEGNGLPLVPNYGTVKLRWNGTTDNRIFTL